MEIEDDIDIEEHDLLQNPMIRNIFPDLSLLKKEIDFYDNEPDEEKPLVSEESPEKTLTTKTVICIDNNTLNSDRSESPQSDCEVILVTELIDQQTVKTESDDEEINTFHGNKIILGSKPCSTPNEMLPETREPGRTPLKKKEMAKEKACIPKIILHDKKEYLFECGKYCSICHILFPKIINFNIHNKKFHCDKGSKQKEQVETVIENYTTSIEKKPFQCDICKIYFGNKGALGNHVKCVHHSSRVPKKTRLTAGKVEKRDVNSVKSNLLKQYKNINGLTGKSDIKRNTDSLNENMIKIGSKIVNDISLKCIHCGKTFSDRKLLTEHLFEELSSKKLNSILKVKEPSFMDVASVIECSHCERTFPDRKCLIDHLYAVLNPKTLDHTVAPNEKCVEPQEKEERRSTRSTGTVETLENISTPDRLEEETIINNNKKTVFRCSVCDHCFMLRKCYKKHMTEKHNIKEISFVLVESDLKCKHCELQFSHTKHYNKHLNNHVRELKQTGRIKKLNEVDDDMEYTELIGDSDLSDSSEYQENTAELVLVSSFFKCNKCDVHFLTAKLANNHAEHMEMLINWKCPECQRIFKQEDSVMHLKQHSLTDNFTVHDLNDSDYTKILYSCQKCAVSFSEDTFLKHYRVCGMRAPKSEYCLPCDILICESIKESHELLHKTKSNFILVEANLIRRRYGGKKHTTKLSSSSSKKLTPNEKRIVAARKHREKAVLKIVYCTTCKCYLTNAHWPRIRDTHLKAQCKHIIQRFCNRCGLNMTVASIKSHKILHREISGLTLQDYNFYSINGRRIFPPIPELPSCKDCGINFINKWAIKSHLCSEEEYKVCDICQIKLAKSVYGLHMGFHKYTMKGEKRNEENDMSRRPNAKTVKMASDVTPKQLERQSQQYLYSCQSCNITLNSYDKLIEHCQLHHDVKNDHKLIDLNTTRCSKCQLTFTVVDFKNHMHQENIRFVKVYFDPLLFLCHKRIFLGLAQDKVEAAIRSSIYRFEPRLKMEITQRGSPDLTLYSCHKCDHFVDPHTLYNHVKTCSGKSKGHPCTICGLGFDTAIYRKEHESVHNVKSIGLTSFNIVTFNKGNDTLYNKVQYLLYQCRKCQCAMDKCQYRNHKCNLSDHKKCSTCGLMFNSLLNNYYVLHFSRHQHLNNYCESNMRVVLFGKSGSTKNYVGKTHTPSFNGTITDYTLYQCQKCKICEKSEEHKKSHVCYFGISRTKCNSCDLYFYVSKLEQHKRLHEADVNFTKDCIDLKLFNAHGRSDAQSIGMESEPECYTEESIKIYKCQCGLHYIDEKLGKDHLKKCQSQIRFSRQKCSKCSLTFTASELFNHLLKHHGENAPVLDVMSMVAED